MWHFQNWIIKRENWPTNRQKWRCRKLNLRWKINGLWGNSWLPKERLEGMPVARSSSLNSKLDLPLVSTHTSIIYTSKETCYFLGYITSRGSGSHDCMTHISRGRSPESRLPAALKCHLEYNPVPHFWIHCLYNHDPNTVKCIISYNSHGKAFLLTFSWKIYETIIPWNVSLLCYIPPIMLSTEGSWIELKWQVSCC